LTSRAPVKQEATDPSHPYATPSENSTPSSSAKSSPAKRHRSQGKTVPPAADEMSAKKVLIMEMMFDAGKSLKAEDIAAKVSAFWSYIPLVLTVQKLSIIGWLDYATG
jgi:hypothetical protein